MDNLPDKQAYQIKHVEETAAKPGNKWQATTKLKSITNGEDGDRYQVDNIVHLSFDESNSDTYGKIVELRATKTTKFIVVQWLYTQGDAGYQNGSKKKKQWPPGVYMLSNHFQVITVENVVGLAQVRVNGDYFWNTAKNDLRSIETIDRALRNQPR